MLKAILFDLDQTLIDFMKLKRNASFAVAKVMVKNGLEIDAKIAGSALFKFYLKDGIDGNTAFSKFIKKYNGSVDDKILALGLNAYHEAKRKYLNAYPNVKSTLASLKKKGIKLAVVTDAPRVKAYQRLDSIGVLEYFDGVVGFEDTKAHKPSKLPFKKALFLLGVSASETLMVGDWVERDIVGASKVGIKTCWAKYGADDKAIDSKADYVIDDVGEILKIV